MPEMERLGIEEKFDKFAELIVQECIRTCESLPLIGPYKDVQDATLKDVVTQIKEHFGVESMPTINYKALYNSELALRLDLETEVSFLNNLINKQEYSTPEKIAEERKKPHTVCHRDVQEAIDKTVKYLGEIRPDVLRVSAAEHLKQLYKIQIAILGRIE
jgi:hypothetical protein